MTANTMPLTNAEEEVRNILDDAISASITASTPGISWGKLMTIIQMQRPVVDDYISQRSKVHPIREVNIGDSVNPFRAEIVKLICALQLTGRFTDTNTASREITRTNDNVIDPYKISFHDNCHHPGCEITVSKKCKNTKWGVKHFVKGGNMHEEKRLLNTYNDAAGGQNCGPFSFTFNVHKEELMTGNKSDQVSEPNIDTTTYRSDYNSYLIARYESEYGDVNLITTKDSDITEVPDKEEAAQYPEPDVYELKKSSTDDLCMYSKNKTENHTASNSLNDDYSPKIDNCINCDEQTPGEDIAKVSLHFHPETCEAEEEGPLGANLFPTYSVICANSSSEHLAQMSHKNARDDTHNKKQGTNEEDSLREVTVSKSVCELYRMKEKSYCYTPINSAPKGNCLNNKILVNDSQLHLNPVAGSQVEHAVNERAYVATDTFKKCSSPPENTAEYLFQNFIQPEDENNIQLLLEHNLSSGHISPHCRSMGEINTALDCALEDTLGNQRRPDIQGNIIDKTEKTGTSILECSSQTTKDSLDSLNHQKKTMPSVGRKEILQELHQVNDFQQNLNNTTSSINTAVSNCISTSYVNTADYECQNKNSDNLFSNKKVYWSSVGLIIEDLIDANVLPVAGQSDMTIGEPQDSKADKKSSTVCSGSTRDQTAGIGSTIYSIPDITNGTEVSSFITEPDVEGSTDLVAKDRPVPGNLLSVDTSAKSKKSQQKRSFLKSLQRVFHLSRKH